MAERHAPASLGRAGRFAVLDGWRALSILFVLAGHWLPLGPANWNMNAAVAASGMALFFALSGFLITHLLLKDDRVARFLLKRIARILPLAWTAMLVIIVFWPEAKTHGLANFLFVANLTPDTLMPGGHHLWSLCVEMQFYVGVALLVLIGGRRALYVLPLLCLFITALRIFDGQIISIVTWHRVDEILVGACLALWWHYRPVADALQSGARAWLPLLALVCLIVSANPQAGEFGYLRPYFAALAIGGSLAAFPIAFGRIFESRPASYIATISYALYVVHGVLTETWLGGAREDTTTRYLLRVPLAISTWLLAHISTHRYEALFSKWARQALARKDASTLPPQRLSSFDDTKE